jgi:ferredoxin
MFSFIKQLFSSKTDQPINAPPPDGLYQVAADASRCVQCGICVSTCRERAISVIPQLDLTPGAKAPRVLNEARIYACIRCGKPLGTEKLVEAMLARLAQHSMFADPGALDRLKMCADCRVVDLIKSEKSADIRDL